MGNIEGTGMALTNLAVLRYLGGDLHRAQGLVSEAIALFREGKVRAGLEHACWLAANLALERGAESEALAFADELKEMCVDAETPHARVHCLALELRQATRSSDAEAVRSIASRARAWCVPRVDAHSWDIEDGPADAWLDAARFFLGRDEVALAAKLAFEVQRLRR